MCEHDFVVYMLQEGLTSPFRWISSDKPLNPLNLNPLLIQLEHSSDSSDGEHALRLQVMWLSYCLQADRLTQGLCRAQKLQSQSRIA